MSKPSTPSSLANGLEKEVKLNIEANHATLAGHSFEHEIATAVALGVFGSIDMNRGDPQNGWDTDQFPNDVREITTALYYILQGGGFTTGGNNFDAKVRRQSIDAGRSLLRAYRRRGHGGARTAQRRGHDRTRRTRGASSEERYAGWQDEPGRAILAGEMTLEAVVRRQRSPKASRPQPRSGRQELIENILGRYI